jgi:hypothetical protein
MIKNLKHISNLKNKSNKVIKMHHEIFLLMFIPVSVLDPFPLVNKYAKSMKLK